MNKIALVALACLTLGACATPVQTVGTAGGVVAGAAIGGPVGAVVGGVTGAVVTRPGSVLGGHALPLPLPRPLWSRSLPYLSLARVTAPAERLRSPGRSACARVDLR